VAAVNAAAAVVVATAVIVVAAAAVAAGKTYRSFFKKGESSPGIRPFLWAGREDEVTGDCEGSPGTVRRRQNRLLHTARAQVAGREDAGDAGFAALRSQDRPVFTELEAQGYVAVGEQGQIP
jgi:hypothetical protein